MILRILKWLGLSVLALLTLLVISNCTMLGLNYASLETANKPDARPAITASSRAEWEAGREALKRDFETHVYGPWPEGLAVSFGETLVADADYLGGKASLEQTEITIGTGEGKRSFRYTVAYPRNTSGPVPVLIGQTFGSTCYVFGSTAILDAEGKLCTRTEFSGFAGFMVQNIFGEYIVKAPVERYVDAGYGYASFQASDVIRDRKDEALAQLAALRESEGIQSTGAIMLWSFGFSAIIDHLETEPRADMARIAVWGHSRHGKSALVAAAWDTRIALTLAHQSGFGGAALSRSTVGEGLDGVTRGGRFAGVMRVPGYPYWFAPEYAEYAGRLDELPVDQHQLIALIAPRAVWLGNGRRDVWSDPNSTCRAAEGASPVWSLYGKEGLSADGMREHRPGDALVYFLRPGGHGVIAADIDAFIAFLDAHFKRDGGAGEITARP